MILMWSCPGNMPKYYPGLRDILPSPTTLLYKCKFVSMSHFYYVLKAYRLSELIIFFILKVANIRYFILIKCSEQEARFKKYVIMS